MKEIMLDFGAILSDLFHALRSGAKKVLIALAVLAALLFDSQTATLYIRKMPR